MNQDELGLLNYLENGELKKKQVGHFLRELTSMQNKRFFKIYRLLFDFMDDAFIGREEKEVFQNGLTYRAFVKDLVEKRRIEMKDPQFHSKGDFLTMLLEDDLFR